MKRLIALALIITHICYGQVPAPNTIGKVVSFNLRDFKAASLNLGQNDALIQNMATKLPAPDGTLVDFILSETLISDRKLPNIQTFDGISTNGTIKIKVTVLADKMEALMHTPNGYFIVEPFDLNKSLYLVYGMSEIPAGSMKCGTNEELINNIVKKNGRLLSISPFPVGSQLRTFRMAAAATGEFVTFYGGQANALARIVSVMNAANLIYELEAAIRFQLITATTNYSLLFTDSATDSFTPDPTFASAAQSQTGFNTMNTNGTLPYANYDVGHTFHIYTSADISSRGQAGPSPCNNSSKASGWTEWSSGTDLSVYLGMVVGVMIHEVGHQFSAFHTYNAIGGSSNSPTFCTDGWSSTDAIEPGGGSTLMSYGGNCWHPTNQSLTGNNNLQYFNTKSLEKIHNYLISTATCYTSNATGNTPPAANAGADITIPKGTPFKLTGSASDANSDPMSYTWEQYDVATNNDKGALGTAIAGLGGYAAVNSTTAPLFRSEMSTTTTERTFPKLVYILNNENNPNDNEGEDLPQVARTMKFRFTVRDNKANGGGVDSDETVVTVVNSGPFLLTSQNTSALWIENGTTAITWSVNGTNTAPLNVANVKISLSTDGGNTFPIVLAANTPNDGSETITVPSNQTTQGRIKIEPVGSYAFFDINNANITISPTCNAEVSTVIPTDAITAQAGNGTLNLGLSAYGNAITSFSGDISNSDAQTSAVFSNAGVCASGNTPYYDVYAFRVGTSGPFTFSRTSGTLSSYVLNLYSNSYSAASPCTNWIASSGTFCSPSVCLSNTVTATLSPGIYYLVVSGFNSTHFGTYTITPSGGTINTLIPNTNSPYAYTYPVVNSAGTITSFSDNSNLTNATTYPADVYTVYGLSYQGGTNLSAYVGTSFSAFQTLLTNNTVCGKLSTNAKTVTITCGSLLAQPGNFTTSSATVCQGQSNVTYTIPAVVGATSYTWTYSGTGVTLTGSAESVTLSFSNAATSGTLSVTANNSCGSSTPRMMSILANLPATANLSGGTSITSGQSTNLSVALTGTSPWSITINGTAYPNITTSPYVLSVSPPTTTVYNLTAVSNGCGPGTLGNSTATVTVTSQSLTTSVSGSSFCAGAAVTVNYTATGTINAGNTFTAQLSNAAGSFASPLVLGTLPSTALTGSISGTIPANTTGGSAYRIRVISSNPSLTGSDNGSNLTINTLATAALSGTQTISAGQSADLSVALTGTSPWSITINGTAYPNITTSPYVLSVSPSTTTVYNLTAVSNGCGTGTLGSSTATVTVNTQSISTLSVSGQVSSFCVGGTVQVLYTATGSFNSGNTFIAQLSDVTGNFDNPVNIGGLITTNTTATISASFPGNAVAGNRYQIRVISTNPAVIGSPNTNTFPINLRPTVSVTPEGPLTLPNGSTIQLNAGVVSNLSYQWLLNGNTILNATNSIYTVSQIGNYRAIATDMVTQCAGASNVVIVTLPTVCDYEISATLISNTNSICPNESAVLRVLGAPFGHTYSWNLNGSTIANEDKPMLMANQAGVYKADITPNWYQVEPNPTHENLYGVTFLNDFNGWIVGEEGIILRTEDAGENWYKIYSEATQTLNDVHFTTSNTGWIAGDGGKFLKSTTGGISWENVGVAFSSKAVDFFSPKIGVVVGSSGNIMYTADEGQTWNHGSSATGNTLNDVKFASSNVVFAVGDGGAFIKSTNGGQTWTSIFLGITATLRRIYFYDENIGFIVGDNGTILKTNNGGVIWNSVSITGEYATREWTDVYFTDTSNGWLIDRGNTLLKTTDGGNTWNLITHFFTDGISLSQASRIVFTNNRSAYIVGVLGAILKSTNTGNNWVSKGNNSSSALNDIQFLDDNSVVAIGDDAMVLKSNDKGKNWSQFSTIGLVKNDWLKAIHFMNSTKGWAAESRGKIFTTNDGGVTWQKQREEGASEFLHDIVFIDSNKGFAVGANGLFIETVDGGVNWSVKNIGYGTSFFKIFFVNGITGWICGQNGIIIRTNDGGITWQQQVTNTTSQISTLFFMNSSVGWASVNAFLGAQTIIKTTDGGNTWNTIATTPTYVRDIKFVDNNKGYVCGGNGYIAATTDGGATWVQKSGNTFTTMNSMVFNSSGVGVVVGDGNTLFRYNPNACTFTTDLVNVSNTLSVNSAILSGTSSLSPPFTYKSNQSISSSQLIHEGANIEYRANNSITLNPGFSTSDQTTFKAEIKGCNN